MTQYSDMDKRELLIEVARFDGSTNKAARSSGVPKRTLDTWWGKLTEDERCEFIVESKKRQEGYWAELHDACLIRAREAVSDMSGRDALIGAGISFDKLRLIRGEPTDIGGTISADAESLAREVESILSKVPLKGEAPASDD